MPITNSESAERAAWNQAEVEATVDDYLAMLREELAGRTYSKSAHRAALLQRLAPGRTAASVEYKHGNVSAVMIEFGLPYVKGYRPRGNYQEALANEVRGRLARGLLGELDMAAVELGPRPLVLDEAAAAARKPSRTGRMVDYGALQIENRKLGTLGERLVVEYERTRLAGCGRKDLADAVRWAATEDGDGLGYDILSFDEDGSHIHIEVKTTRLGPDTPFYLSSSELAFASENPETSALYRVFDVAGVPRFFAIRGSFDDQLHLVPVTFRARLR